LLNQLKQKTSLTSLEISVLCKELDQKLENYYIENIYHPDFSTLLLRLNKPAQPEIQLIIEAGKTVYITRYTVKKPVKPSIFCSTLRKYLLNGRIKKVEQPNFERIIIFHILTSKGNFRLIIELFSKGNILLVDEEEKIVQALTYKKMRDRLILRSEKFKLPPPTGLNPEKLSFEEFFSQIKESKGELVRVLTRILGVGGIYTEEILKIVGVEKSLTCEKLTEFLAKKIYDALKEIFRRRDNPQPCIVYLNHEKPLDVLPFPLSIYNGKHLEYYLTYNEALDEYFTRLRFEKEKMEEEKRFGIQLEEQKRILKEQENMLEKLEEEERKNRFLGDLIYRFSGEIQTLINYILEEVNHGKSWEEIEKKVLERKLKEETPFIFFKSLDPKNKILKVFVEDTELPLNLNKTIYQNASTYYDEAKKIREKISKIKKLLEETSRKIQTLESKMEIVKVTHEKPKKIPEKKWFEKYRFFQSSEGFLVVSGKDAHSNEALIKRYTEPWDIVFHADLIGAPFTVIKTQGKTPNQKTLEEAAQFTVCYSRAWKDEFSSMDAYYIKPEQLSKSAPSGQYLGRGAFFIVGSKNYIKNVPLKLAVGVKINGEKVEILIGPKSAIEKITSYIVEIFPGKDKAKDVAFRLRAALANLVPKNLREKILKIPLEKFVSLIPYGKAYFPRK